MYKRITQKILNLVFPPRCIFCKQILSTEKDIEVCDLCYKKIPFINEKQSNDRIKVSPKGNIDYTICLCKYESIIKSSLIRFKFYEKPSYYRTFAKLLANKIKNMTNLDTIDIIISVPLHKKKKAQRGYNQSLLISRQLAKELCVIERSKLIKRIRNTDSQSLLKKKRERYLNVKDAFSVNNADSLVNKTVLLVDDISTTGFTLEECAKVLKRAGAKNIIGAVIASGNDAKM